MPIDLSNAWKSGIKIEKTGQALKFSFMIQLEEAIAEWKGCKAKPGLLDGPQQRAKL